KQFVYLSVRDALKASEQTVHARGPGLMKSLTGASLPGLVALGVTGGNPAAAIGAYGATMAAQAAAKRLSREATFQPARLVRAAQAGNATAEMALNAVKVGVPAATVNTIMSGVGKPLALAGAA